MGDISAYGMTERVLAVQRSHQMRLFRKLDTLVLYLRIPVNVTADSGLS